MADLEVLAERVHGQGRPDELGEPHHEQLQSPEVGHALQARQLLAHQEVPVLARPPARLRLVASEKGLGKASELQEIAKLGRAPEAQLARRQRMHPEEGIAALE